MPLCNALPNHPIEAEIRLLLADHLGCNPQSIQIMQLKDGIVNCYNNTDYLVTIENKKYFAKYGNPNGEILGTSLANDITCRAIAAKYKISPPLLTYNLEATLMITEYIETQGEIDLKDLSIKKRYVDLLKKLHASGAQFPLTFCPFQIIQQYVDHSCKRGVTFPPVFFEKVLPTINQFKKSEIFLDNAPCHLDPQTSNILDNDTELYLIDWECAAMTDPLFDLACISAIEEFSETELLELLVLYLKKQPSTQDIRRFYQMRILADIRYCTYCFLQTKLSITRKELFKIFAEGFLNRTIELINIFNLLEK